jgi:8-oxo-dGTP diphosphatase
MIGPMPVRHQTLCFVFRRGDRGQRQILLGRKKKGFGAGKIMGLGGHVDPGESEAECALREVYEEAGIVIAPDSATWRAEFDFIFPNQPEWDAIVTVFFGERWSGQVEASEEIIPEWFDADSLPFDQMWDDESHWLPRVLAGELLAGTITYDDSGMLVRKAELDPVERLSHSRWNGS